MQIVLKNKQPTGSKGLSSLLIIKPLFSFILTILACSVLIDLCKKYDICMDYPSGRKKHMTPTPVIGGVAIAITFFIGHAVFYPELMMTIWPFFAGSLMLVIVGTMDDHKHISAWPKLLVQIIASSIFVFLLDIQFGQGLFYLLTGMMLPTFLASCIAVFILVAIVNAVNFMDGMDGLVTSFLIAIIILGSIFVPNLINAQENLVLLGGLFGFLFFNFPFRSYAVAKSFMGDSGAKMIAFIIAGMMLLHFDYHTINVLWKSEIMFMVVFFVPLLDMIRITIKRIMNGLSPFHSDRSHLHHILMNYIQDRRKICVFYAVVLGGTLFFMGNILGV